MVAQSVCSSTEQESEGSPAKKKKTCLEKLLGEKFQTEPLSTGVVTVPREELVQVEVSRYKSEPPLWLSKPLEWWSSHRHAFPNLATMAQKPNTYSAQQEMLWMPKGQLFYLKTWINLCFYIKTCLQFTSSTGGCYQNVNVKVARIYRKPHKNLSYHDMYSIVGTFLHACSPPFEVSKC